MEDIKKLVWQEQYRPKKVIDVISPFTKQILIALENPMIIQNFIFYSRMGGTGKTSMSKAIVNDLQCDY
jgi:AAA+ superfamily predicted ATPase